jgi:2-oxoacid:acceptor oxidoreductase gamma subunit (pyruvate/2-ketoisovalerate family)
MQEIRFHGRGGQGTVLASISLAKAYFDAGYEVQTFPLFGVERRGAPVEAFLRIDHQKILLRCNVYAPDHIVVMDNKLLLSIDVTRGMKPGGWILINAPKPPVDIRAFSGFKVAWVDAAGIALSHRLGSRTSPIINTAMLGAYARTHGEPAMEYIEQAIVKEVPVKRQENVLAAKEAFEKVQLIGPV